MFSSTGNRVRAEFFPHQFVSPGWPLLLPMPARKAADAQVVGLSTVGVRIFLACAVLLSSQHRFCQGFSLQAYPVTAPPSSASRGAFAKATPCRLPWRVASRFRAVPMTPPVRCGALQGLSMSSGERGNDLRVCACVLGVIWRGARVIDEHLLNPRREIRTPATKQPLVASPACSASPGEEQSPRDSRDIKPG